MKDVVIILEELVCPMCATKIETALKKLDGAENVEVFYNSSKAKLQIDPNKLNEEKLIEAINRIGYDIIKVRVSK